MNISLKLLLYTHKTYSDGKHPIVLQFITKRSTKRKVIHKCFIEEWDDALKRIKTKVPNSAYINKYLSEKYAEAEQSLFSVKTGDSNEDSLFESKEELTLGEAFDMEMERLKSDMKVGSYNKVNGFKTQISDFTNIDNLFLSSMDLNWFQKFAKHLKNLGNNGTTAQKKIKTIRSIVTRYYKESMSEELKNFKIPSNKTVKQKLNSSEMKALEDLCLPDGDLVAATRDLFLLQVYLRGVRVGDILQASSDQFKNGFFTFTDDKTSKTVSMKIIVKAQQIVDRYVGKHERLFPFFKWSPNKKLSKFDNKAARMKEKEICTAVVNKYLKIIAKMAGIDKPLSSHIARHTFARMAIDKINNPMVTMELLGHSSLAVHQNYLNDIRKDDELDQAADDIFG